MRTDFDTIVVGAGVVGLACARQLAAQGRQVCVLEREARPGEGISSRNSGVIHAGLYYPENSLKAQLCTRGRDLLYAWCQARSIWHHRIGKLVVATDPSQLDRLRALKAQAQRNQVQAQWLHRADARTLEPALRCEAALWVPQSGLVDVPELIDSLVADLQQHDGLLVCRSPVHRILRRHPAPGFQIELQDGSTTSCHHLVNAAGLDAPALARRCQDWPEHRIPQAWYARGHYYGCSRPVPFSHLIYPLPDPAGLGVHLGFDPAGRARFGPDLRWCAQPDYAFDDGERNGFARAIRQWWPQLQDADLQPDFVGVRPKISGPGMPNADFLVADGSHCGLPGMFHLFGIESPGLTSSLALAEYLASRLRQLRD